MSTPKTVSKIESSDPIQGMMNSGKSFASKKWGSPAMVIAISVIAALLTAFTIYYTVIPMFRAGPQGLLVNEADKWYARGSGFVLALLVGILIVCVAGSLALTCESNMDGIIIAALLSITLGLVFNFAFRSALDNEQTQFVLWTIVAVVGSLAPMIYAVWYTMSTLSKAKKAESASLLGGEVNGADMSDDSLMYGEDKADRRAAKGLAGRSTWIYVLAGVGLIVALILVYVHYSLYSSMRQPTNDGYGVPPGGSTQ